MITNKLFNIIKNKIPKISNTELIALRSGNTSIDRSILQGKINNINNLNNLNNLNNIKKNSKFNKLTDDLLENYSKDIHKEIYPNNNNNYWINYLAKNKFFSFLISEKYGGNKLSVNEMSSILTKISSIDPALGVIAMVPNSLGPGELLSHYGTDVQKNKYLPGLADGTYIPCFGLTGPNNGSDATGKIDKGTIVNYNGKLNCSLTFI